MMDKLLREALIMKYEGEIAEARANNLGMWSMKFEYPWDYRKKN